jgi:uncharacterized protein
METIQSAEGKDKATASRIFLLAELFVLFIILPLLYWFDVVPFHKLVPLVALFMYCGVILYQNGRIDKSRFRVEANWAVILMRFAVIAVVIMLSLKYSCDTMFADLTNNRKLLMMLILYPLLSAFPQELIFREFFFFRYERLFRRPEILIAINVILFSFAHIYFQNWIVIFFTLAGGLLFALTFLKTRSLLVVAIEHSLYGLVILSSALHVHFYKAF